MTTSPTEDEINQNANTTIGATDLPPPPTAPPTGDIRRDSFSIPLLPDPQEAPTNSFQQGLGRTTSEEHLTKLASVAVAYPGSEQVPTTRNNGIQRGLKRSVEERQAKLAARNAQAVSSAPPPFERGLKRSIEERQAKLAARNAQVVSSAPPPFERGLKRSIEERKAKLEARDAQVVSSNPPPIQHMVISKRAAQYATTGSTTMAATNPLNLTDLQDDLMPQAMPTAPTLQPPTLGPGAYRGSAATMERNNSLYKGVLGREADTFHEGDSTHFIVGNGDDVDNSKELPSSEVPSDGEDPTSEHPQDAAPPIMTAGNLNANNVPSDEEDPTSEQHLQDAAPPIMTAGNLNANSLVVARRVSETTHQGELPQAEEVDPAEEERKLIQLKKQKRQLLWRIGFATFAICSIILAVALGLTMGRKDEKAPKISLENYVLSLLPTYTQESIGKDDISPQSKAYDWIMADPNLDTYADERIIQRYALGTLYHATDGDRWFKNTNWLSYEVHECEWHAQDAIRIFSQFKNMGGGGELFFNTVITPFLNASFPCGDPVVEKKYTYLWLLANGLKGQLPPEVYLLTSLRHIGLSVNSLTGSALSTEIGKLTSLGGLDLFSNRFSGTVPTEIGLLSRLMGLGVRKNEFSGTLPSQLGQLSDNLMFVDLNDNLLAGSIPPSLGSLEKMVALIFYENQLSGTIPTCLGQLSEMKWLYLGANELLGTIPTQLGLLGSLEALRLDQNSLTGNIPWEIGKLVLNGSLESFHIHTNNLTGALPTDDLCLIDTVSNYDSQLIGCNCTCSYQRNGFQLCSPLPHHCKRL